MSRSTTLADLAAKALNDNAEIFSRPFSASRVAVPRDDLQDFSSLRILIVPMDVKIEQMTRAIQKWTIKIDLGVQSKTEADLKSAVGSLGCFADEVIDFFRGRDLDPFQWRGTETTTYSAKHLTQFGVFTSIITLEYSCLLES